MRMVLSGIQCERIYLRGNPQHSHAKSCMKFSCKLATKRCCKQSHSKSPNSHYRKWDAISWVCAEDADRTRFTSFTFCEISLLSRWLHMQCCRPHRMHVNRFNKLMKSLNLEAAFGWSFFLSSCRARSRLWRSSKRIVFDQLFSHCSRTGEKQKARCLPKLKQTNPKHKHNPKQHNQEDTQKTRWNTTLSEGKILMPLSTSSRWHSNSRK